MKTNFKRLFALLLTLCMLASLMVPVAFAEDVATDAPSANVAETYQIRLKDLNHTDPTTATGLDALLVVNGSQTGTNYKSGLSLGTAAIANAYPATLNWKFYATSSELIYRTDRMWQARLTGWGAIQIHVTEPGVYALNMTTDKTDDKEKEVNSWTNCSYNDAGEIVSDGSIWAGNVVAYIIPLSDVEAAIAAGTVTTEAEDGTVTTTAPTAAEIIPTLMTDKYSVGSDYLAAADTTVTFDEIRMDAGEYVVVYEADEAAYSISEMSLVGDPYEVTEIANYAIRPVEIDTISAEEAYLAGGLASKFVVVTDATYTYTTSNQSIKYMDTATYYNNGDIEWKWLEGVYYYRPATNYQLRLDKNAKLALQIKVPKTGFYALTLSTATDGAYSAAAYVLNVNDLPEGAKCLDQAVAANSIGSANFTASDPAIFNTKYYEAGEYIVILENGPSSNLPINALSLIQYSSDVIEEGGYTSTQEISYKLYNIDDPVFNQIEGETTTFAAELSDGNGGTTNLQDYVAALYAEGKLDWKIEAYPTTFTGANFVSEKAHDRGIEVSTPGTNTSNSDPALDTDWFAIRFRVKDAGYYSITPQMRMSALPGVSAYLIPASEETMTADEIQAQIVPENGLAFYNMYEKTNDPVSVGYLEGEYIIAYKAPYNKIRTFTVQGILLESEAPLGAADVQNFAFDMFAEGNPYYELLTDRYSATAVKDEATGLVTGYTYTKLDPYAVGTNAQFESEGFVTLGKDAEGNPNYSIVNKTNTETGEVTQTLDDGLGTLWAAALKADGTGYPDTLNWRPDDTNVSTNTGKWYRAHNLEGNSGHFKFENNNTAGTYGSVMLHVEKAGTYNLSIENGQYATNNIIYFVDDFVTDYSKAHSDDAMALLMIEDNIIGNAEGVSIAANAVAELGEVTIDAAGDYLIVFKTVGTSDVWLKNITLTPVVEEIAAVVAGQTYATVAEAVAAAAEGDTITLMDTVINGGNIVVPAGATLNLSGYSVYADVIDATAPGAKIVDPADGGAALFADELIFDENNNNPQLPLLDKTTGAYHLFNVDVVSSATTGKHGATKYWFKVNFSNADALALIGSSTELRINALMTGTYKEDGTDYAAGDPWSGTATADAAFSNTWAENSNKYIVVYSVGSAFNSFRLRPAVSANGVIISGDAMSKGN